MVHDNHLMDMVECNRGVNMLPEGPAPIPIRPIIHAQRRACQDHIIVSVQQVPFVLHIFGGVMDQSVIHAAQQREHQYRPLFEALVLLVQPAR